MLKFKLGLEQRGETESATYSSDFCTFVYISCVLLNLWIDVLGITIHVLNWQISKLKMLVYKYENVPESSCLVRHVFRLRKNPVVGRAFCFSFYKSINLHWKSGPKKCKTDKNVQYFPQKVFSSCIFPNKVRHRKKLKTSWIFHKLSFSCTTATITFHVP